MWKRDSNTHVIIPGDYAREEFFSVNRWTVTEKIDGTNIRVRYDYLEGGRLLEFKGRTDKALIPKALLVKLNQLFTIEKIEDIFANKLHVVLFGEGYGHKIQKNGSKYIKDDVDFILFDIWADGMWYKQDVVSDIAIRLGIGFVPELVIMKNLWVNVILEDFFERWKVQGGDPRSIISASAPMEGIVATSNPLMLFQDGTPIKWKLKYKDYDELERKHGQ